MLLTALVLLTPPAWAATSQRLSITNASANEEHFMKGFDAPATGLGDFNGDGSPELVAHNDNQYVYVLSTTESRVLAEFRPDYPSGWGVRAINEPVVADVDNDGRLDIVVVNSAAYVCVYEYTGGTSTRFSFAKQWCSRMNAYDGSGAAADAGAWVEDVTGDGRKEIFSNTEKRGLYAFNWDGSVRWRKDLSGGNAGPVVTDLEGDGRKEVVFFGDAGEVRALDGSSGSTRWQFFANSRVWPASIPRSGNVADLDNDGTKEVVFVARDAHDSSNYDNNHFMLFVLSHTGGVEWSARPSWGNPMSYTAPILHDLNGDGRRDILLQDWNTIGHKPGNWEQLGPANVFAYSHAGALLWRTELDNSWSNDDLALADVDNDGALEVLAIGFGPGGDGVWYLNARTGAKETFVVMDNPEWTILRGPVLGNLGGTGRLGWAISVHDSGFGGAFKAFVTDTTCQDSRIAFGGWQNRHGCSGSSSGGGTTPPPPTGGSFSATFEPRNGNDWWIQVKVTASKSLAGVDARVNGGAWQALELKSWGDWARSIHAPDGSVVEFRARATDGSIATSGGFVWPSGTPTGGSGGGGGGSFTATFFNVRGNEWWIETEATMSEIPRIVQARVNGGAWIDLDLTSWGSWARSIHAPAGSQVQFQAVSTSGATAQSGIYAWPPG